MEQRLSGKMASRFGDRMSNVALNIAAWMKAGCTLRNGWGENAERKYFVPWEEKDIESKAFKIFTMDG